MDGRLVRHQDTDWGRITRVHPFPTDKRNIPARALAFGGFTALVAGMAVRVAAADPTSCWPCRRRSRSALAGWLAARARRVPFVFNIQDVFPDVAVELGVITNPAGDRRGIGARATDLPARRRRHRAVRRPARQRRLRRSPATGPRIACASSRTSSTSSGSDPRPKENSYRGEFGLDRQDGRDVRRQRRLLAVARPAARRRNCHCRTSRTSCS